MLRPAPKDRSAFCSRQLFGSAGPANAARPSARLIPALPGRIMMREHRRYHLCPEDVMELNGATIPSKIVRRSVERRCTEHCFAELDPARTALVVIDLQHAFMNEAVGHAVVAAARDIVPAVNRLAAAVRQKGGGVFCVQMTHDDNCLDDWSIAFEMSTPAMRQKRIAALSEGGLGHQLWPDLDVKPEDEIVKKYRYSGFLPGKIGRAHV